MAADVRQAFLGSFFHTPTYGSFEYLEDALVEVDAGGVIVRVVRASDPRHDELARAYRESGILVELGPGRYGLPGFVDLHVHACQWPQAGIALDEPLESKFADVEFAHTVYRDLVRQLLARGTTTVVYFGSAHLAASIELARACVDAGQRGLVGKTVMDDPAANPDYYRDASPKKAVEETAQLIREVEAMRPDAPQGVWPVITPRFIPSCTDEVLRGLGNLAAEHDAYVQSHCNEGQWEHDTVLARFGKEDPYALRDFGLLREHSIMAHCTFLTPDEGELFAQVGAGIAHCPISNAYFASSVLPVKRLREQGVHIGLGTDISGGFSPNMYDNIRQAVMASRMLETGVDAQRPEAERGSGDARISVVEALYLATAGGAEALGLPVGTFEPGRAFDLQVIDTRLPYADLTGFGVFDAPEDRLARILYLATPDNIRQVYVQGRRVIDK